MVLKCSLSHEAAALSWRRCGVQAEIMELRADRGRRAEAYVVEASVQKGLGALATVSPYDSCQSVIDHHLSVIIQRCPYHHWPMTHHHLSLSNTTRVTTTPSSNSCSQTPSNAVSHEA